MNVPTVTAEELVTLARKNNDMPYSFINWLEKNPTIYEAFEKFVLGLIAEGRQHYSSRTVIELLRHHSGFVSQSDGPYKIGDHHSPYTARLFLMRHPQHEGFFKLKQIGQTRYKRES